MSNFTITVAPVGATPPTEPVEPNPLDPDAPEPDGPEPHPDPEPSGPYPDQWSNQELSHWTTYTPRRRSPAGWRCCRSSVRCRGRRARGPSRRLRPSTTVGRGDA